MTFTQYVTGETSDPAGPVRTVPIDQIKGDMDSLRKRIQSGQAYLRVVAYPWGVEFEVCDRGDKR